uniref:EGF-like domain-containing protein n=1 Tax=Panagrolaimus sp. JU765 TaxID=591449 RepID=A0AC34RFR6_9BILA
MKPSTFERCPCTEKKNCEFFIKIPSSILFLFILYSIHACTPEEIMNALKKSGDNQDQILQEVSSSQADYSTEFNQEDEEMNATACPTDETFQFRCENGGLCFHDGMIPFCHCINGYTGSRCQYYWNNDIHGAAIAAPEVQSAALTTMLTIIIIGLLVAFGLVYFSKTYCKARDLRDYMYPASVIDEQTLTPVMVYPFTRRSHCCTYQVDPASVPVWCSGTSRNVFHCKCSSLAFEDKSSNHV